MSYERLTPRQKQAVDILVNGQVVGRGRHLDALAAQLGVGRQRTKQILSGAAQRYGIDRVAEGKFNPTVRLVYLRAKELNLI